MAGEGMGSVAILYRLLWPFTNRWARKKQAYLHASSVQSLGFWILSARKDVSEIVIQKRKKELPHGFGLLYESISIHLAFRDVGFLFYSLSKVLPGTTGPVD